MVIGNLLNSPCSGLHKASCHSVTDGYVKFTFGGGTHLFVFPSKSSSKNSNLRSLDPVSVQDPMSVTSPSLAELDVEMFLCFGHMCLSQEHVHAHQINSD